MTDVERSGYRRKLKTELRKARGAARLTQRVAAEKLAWSESKLIRIENGVVGLSVTDLQALLKLYGVTDQQAVKDLTAAARGSRGSAWWSGYHDVVSPTFALYLGQEASAADIRVFHPFLIPGLLHTEEYAFELLRVHCSNEDAHRIVAMRRERQQRHLYNRADCSEMIFVFGEEALHRWIGGPAVMQRQLEHLLHLAKRPGLSLRIIPFGAGAHPGLLGPFILLSFDEPAERLLFVEGLSGDLINRSDEERVAMFGKWFDVMSKSTLPPDQAEMLVTRIIGKFRQAQDAVADAAQPSTESLSATTRPLSKTADVTEEQCRSSSGDVGNQSPCRPPEPQSRSSAFSGGQSAIGAAPSASSRSSVSFFSSLSSALL